MSIQYGDTYIITNANQNWVDLGKLYEENKVTNLICLGDSEIEIEAGNKLSAMFVETFLKTVKIKN